MIEMIKKIMDSPEEHAQIQRRNAERLQQQILDGQDRIQRRKDETAGIVPGKPFAEYGFIPMTSAFFAEVEQRAKLKFILPAEAKILREAQAKWDAGEKIIAQYSMIAVTAKWQKMHQGMPSTAVEDLDKMKIPTLQEMKIEAIEHRRALRPKFQQITQEVFPTVAAILNRLQQAANKVFKEVEAEEKSFAMRLGFEHKPSQFQIALCQLTWRFSDFIRGAGELASAPKDMLAFLPEINDYFK
jgi:hypothetical protein